MSQFELVVVLLIACIPLVALANRLKVAYPIVLVLAGLALGFVPGLPQAKLPPDIILVIFLPPLLFRETVTAPTRAFRVFAQPILRLAVGLVFVTTGAVAAAMHAIVPDLPWGAAFAFGAIVAPTDEVAFSPVAERFAMPQRVIAIVQGESLLNDATSLVIYAVAIAAVVHDTFSLAHAGVELLLVVAGSIAIGMLAGLLVSWVSHIVREPMLVVLASLLGGYTAYIPAQHLGLSGVLATVIAAFVVVRQRSTEVSPAARVLARGAWDVLIFVLNTTIFILVGLQLGPLVRGLHGVTPAQLLLDIVVVNVLVVGVRIVWNLGVAYPIDRFVRTYEEIPPWKNYALVAWSGIRGGVSLAAALAIPLLLANGKPFPHRDLLLVLTFSTILVTLVGQGLTLPYLVKLLGIPRDDGERHEEQKARAAMTRASLRALDRIKTEEHIDDDVVAHLRKRYESHVLDPARRDELRAFHAAEDRLLVEQHEALRAMRKRGEIENTVMLHLETQLDLRRLLLAEERDHATAPEKQTESDDADV